MEETKQDYTLISVLSCVGIVLVATDVVLHVSRTSRGSWLEIYHVHTLNAERDSELVIRCCLLFCEFYCFC